MSEVSGPIAKANQAIVFRAKYYKTTGPCIQFGDAIGMPIIDAFKVVDVLKGNLKATSINVRAMSEGGSSYPKNLAEGTIYTLRLTPSATTTNQLQENEKEEGATFFWINGNEIEEFQAAK